MPLDPLDAFKLIYEENPRISRDRGLTSESDTRANILDRIIHEVLLWPRIAVRREPFANPGYIDFMFTHGRPVMIWEAKSEGQAFSFPHRKQPRRRMKIAGTLTSDAFIRKGIEQVQRYCADTGTRYGLISNGYSFIIFRAIVEGQSWRGSDAIVFHDYNDILNHFTEFWDLLSYEGIADGKLDASFRISSVTERGHYRPIDQFVEADAIYGRNPLNSILRPYVEQFFGDIAAQNATDVLKHCYVYSQPIQTIDSDLSLVIRDSIPHFVQEAKTVHHGREDEAGTLGRDLISAAQGANNLGSVVILMGGIGSGKSTFCRRFFRVIAPDLCKADGLAILVYMNFLGAPDDSSQLDSFLWHTLTTSLKTSDPTLKTRPILELLFSDDLEVLEDVYSADSTSLEKRKNNLLFENFSDDRKFGEAALRYLLKKGKLPIIVFDNVDQLRFEAQAEIFTSAQHLANAHSCFSLLVMREESLSAALMKKHLTAYAIRPYHLSSPRFNELLRLRIDFAANEAVRKAREVQATPQERNYGDVVELFRLLRRSVLGQNRNIIRLVESIAYGNMRLALALFNSFITSGATDMRKIVDAFLTGGYAVPFHEFAKSVMLGDYRYYKEVRSPIANLFYVNKYPNSSHFTTLRVLRFLKASSPALPSGEGFVGLQSLINAITDLFGNDEDCKATVERLIVVDRQLVELDTRRTDSLGGASSIRITSAGMYYLQYLLNSFAYLDLVWHDTALSERSICDNLRRRIGNTEMEKRFERVGMFLDYLEEAEADELKEKALNASGFWGPFMPACRKQYESEKAHILFGRDKNRRESKH